MNMSGFMFRENVALKAEVASLKLQNESLEIRLAAANDRIVSLQQFCEGETVMRREAEEALRKSTNSLKEATGLSEYHKSQWHSVSVKNEKLKQELMRRGADDPDKPKPPCDTAFAALQVVCKNWDREECFADLRKQRAENLRRIDALKSGRELKMGHVVAALDEDTERPTGTLLYALGNLREQLRTIIEYDTGVLDMTHPEWFEPPLSLFRRRADEDEEVVERTMEVVGTGHRPYLVVDGHIIAAV